MLAHMTLLESVAFQPINFAIGGSVFLLLVALMAILHGFGASRPQS
jgi:hypothetical protein